MKEFKTRIRNGKTKVRGRFKTSLFAFNAEIAINFGRIFRYIIEYDLINELFLPNALFFLKNLLKNNFMFFSTRKPDCRQANFGLIRAYTKYFSNLLTLAA